MTSEPTTGGPSEADRRTFHRKKFRGTLEIEWGSATLTATVRDIGPKGLFVELTPPLWVGATFHARLLVDPVLLLDCTVRRVEPGGGIALTFDTPQGDAIAQLEALLAGLPQS